MMNSATAATATCPRRLILICAALSVMGCTPEDAPSETTQPAPAAQNTPVPDSRADADTELRDQTGARAADSHVHGGAVLSVVSEGNRLTIELETPLFNVLGFEYAPRTPAETEAVARAQARLAVPATLFRINSQAGCVFEKPESPVTLFPAENDYDHDDDHGDHAGETHDDAGDAGAHKATILRYTARCRDLSKLGSVDVGLFEAFANFEDIDLVYLGPSRQMQVELSPSQTLVDLRR